MGVIRYMSWISTKRQMPPIGKNILIFTDLEYYKLAQSIDEPPWAFLIIKEFTNNTSKTPIYTSGGRLTRGAVVCWTYLPELIISKKKKVIKKVSIFELMDI